VAVIDTAKQRGLGYALTSGVFDPSVDTPVVRGVNGDIVSRTKIFPQPPHARAADMRVMMSAP
jgi:hypothetical protein